MLSDNGVRRERMPEDEVWRIWCKGPVAAGSSTSMGVAEDVCGSGRAVIEGESEERRRVMEVGKWPVWKVDLWRRRWPERDLGSGLQMLVRLERGGW